MSGPFPGVKRPIAREPHESMARGRGALAAKHDVEPAVAIDVACGYRLGAAGGLRQRDDVRLPRIASAVEPAEPVNLFRPHGEEHVFQSVAVEVSQVKEHSFKAL